MKTVPSTFWKRKLHSLAGLFFVLFLCEHLITNSEAVFSKRGEGFIRMVNFLQDLPYLPVIEITLLAVPIGIHLLLGIRYLYESNLTSCWKGDGSKPYLPFLKNHLFSWQRITAMIIAVGVIAHVTTMRFIQKPVPHLNQYEVVISSPANTLIAASDFGTAVLVLLKDTFTHVWVCVLYTIFVCAASFHAGNGLWTFCIAWGITLNERGRHTAFMASVALGSFLAFLGSATIWLLYL